VNKVGKAGCGLHFDNSERIIAGLSLVDAGPNEARKRMRDTMAPLNHKTQISTYPLISHWKFPTVVTD
jgi:hypothetical protein